TIFKLTANGTNWLGGIPHLPGYDGWFNALLVEATNAVYVGGLIDYVVLGSDWINMSGTNIYKWDGSQVSSVGDGLNGDGFDFWGEVLAIATVGGDLYVGG